MVATLEQETSAQAHTTRTGERLIIPANELPSPDRFSIGRDKLNIAIANLDPEARRQVESFWSYCAQRNLGRDSLGQLLLKPTRYTRGSKKLAKPQRDFYSADSIYQLLTGRRMDQGTNIAPMLSAIEEFLAKVQPNTKTAGFVETRLFREIEAYYERAVKRKRIGFIFGQMSVGKSACARKIASEHSGCLYTQVATRGQLGDYLRKVAAKTVMGVRSTAANLHERVIAAIPDALFVDDADECFRSLRNSWGIDTLQFIKEIYEQRERAIIIIMDNFGRDRMLKGDHAYRLGRLWRRRLEPLQLADSSYPEDLDAHAAAFGLPPAPEEPITVNVKWSDEAGAHEERHTDSPLRLQNEIDTGAGIGVWRMLLEDAADLAEEKKKPISWGAVLKAYALFAAKEAKATPDDPPPDTRRKR